MKDLCLAYDDEKKLGAMSRSESDALVDECGAVNEGIRESGHYLSLEALQPVHTATTVRIRNGKVSITDSPFADTKEQLGWFYLVDARDLNDAQKEAVDIWYNKKARALEIVAEITKIPANVVEYAYGQTVQMLHGLSDEQIDTLLVQLKLIKESGFVKSEIWDDPERVKKEYFWRG